MGGEALADVLFGSVSPSGRLPFTVVETLEQLPDELDMNMSALPGRTYRWARTAAAPLAVRTR